MGAEMTLTRDVTLRALVTARATVSALELRRAGLDAALTLLTARAKDGSATDDEVTGSTTLASNARAVALELTSARATLADAELEHAMASLRADIEDFHTEAGRALGEVEVIYRAAETLSLALGTYFSASTRARKLFATINNLSAHGSAITPQMRVLVAQLNAPIDPTPALLDRFTPTTDAGWRCAIRCSPLVPKNSEEGK